MELLAGCDLAVLLQSHGAYDLAAIAAAAPRVFDARGRMHGDAVERL